MMTSAKLTVLIPCKDEERNIEHCVASARGVADEILVADSGSTDDTLRMVRALGGCRIIERDFIGYADFKNWAIPQAAHEWVLILDADERVTMPLADEIKGLLASPLVDRDAFWIFRRNFILGHEVRFGGWSRDKVLRLIRRDRCRYNSVLVHEEIDIPPERAGRLQSRLLHFTAATHSALLAKSDRYTLLAAQEAFARGKRPHLARMVAAAPLRFFQTFVLGMGFLDGMLGFQIAALTAYGSYLKQARLWELHFARSAPEPAIECRPRLDKAA